ncbi:hypothetical protein [Streptomyces sp. SM12]|uniref:hypothetical protein n=1 Tax=Streptomyces sp. SM12 TaxID=1071602 RepID=UPI000CD4D28F|nr:hypothetical protein [Streptomyces sp. SM12]
MNLSESSDRTRLIQLLAMLPGRDDVEFWNQVGRAGAGYDPETSSEDATPDLDGYVLDKMQSGVDQLLEAPGNQGDIALFCHYLLGWFDGERPLLWKYLNRYFLVGDYTDAAGERICRELSDAAWRLYFTCQNGDSNTLREQWPGHHS